MMKNDNEAQRTLTSSRGGMRSHPSHPPPGYGPEEPPDIGTLLHQSTPNESLSFLSRVLKLMNISIISELSLGSNFGVLHGDFD
jgi:hypothetical protein